MDMIASSHRSPFCSINSESLSKFVMAFGVIGFLITGFTAYATFPLLPKVWAMISRKGRSNRQDYVELNRPSSSNNQHTVCAPFPPIKKAQMSNHTNRTVRSLWRLRLTRSEMASEGIF
jgi:hypothetical protein